MEPGYSKLEDRGLPKWICFLLLTYEGGMIDNRWPVLLVYPVVRAESSPTKATWFIQGCGFGLPLGNRTGAVAYVTIFTTQCSFSALLSFLIIV